MYDSDDQSEQHKYLTSSETPGRAEVQGTRCSAEARDVQSSVSALPGGHLEVPWHAWELRLLSATERPETNHVQELQSRLSPTEVEIARSDCLRMRKHQQRSQLRCTR